ncbi:MAG: DUF488 domain-containing protein [candidate division WOR-3 bacterium]
MGSSKQIILFTIGYSKKSAKDFFELLKKNNVRRVVDVRLNNTGIFAGFTKKDDLEYFLRRLLNIKYLHKPEFAPTKELLKQYRKKIISWDVYSKRYLAILKKRNVIKKLNIQEFHLNCFLCSEAQPQKCHRRLLVEYLKTHFRNRNIKIIHLLNSNYK